MNGPRRSLELRAQPVRQAGVVLFISLIVLVAMSLAGIALVRSVDTNVLIAGNLAFRQAAILAGETAVANARDFVVVNSGSLNSDRPSDGYFSATAIATATGRGFDPVAHNWSNSVALPVDAAGNRARYVVHRMCAEPDKEPTATNCVRAGATGTATSSFGSIDYSRYPLTLSSTVPAYRITVRIDAPKNSVSYVQVVVFP
jgi:type IV pilus assembly protein PilX